jgi:hypothetical protein
MTRCVGGSWDGTERPGYPFRQRMLVLFKRGPDGSSDLKMSETYLRKEPGGEWFFGHDGTAKVEDGSWYFENGA